MYVFKCLKHGQIQTELNITVDDIAELTYFEMFRKDRAGRRRCSSIYVLKCNKAYEIKLGAEIRRSKLSQHAYKVIVTIILVYRTPHVDKQKNETIRCSEGE